jgi:GNAT superfamily N-acetyltransferase
MRKPIPSVELRCIECQQLYSIKCLPHRDYSSWRCRKCAIKLKWTDPAYRANRPKPKPKPKPKRSIKKPRKLSKAHRSKISQSLKGRKIPDEVKARIAETNKAKFVEVEMKRILSANSKAAWTNDAYRTNITSKIRKQTSSQSFKAKMAGITKNLWANDEYRNKVLATKSTPEFKAKMAAIASSPGYKKKLAIAANRLPSISSLQVQLYSLLDDLGVKYYREREGNSDSECIIGPWAFDCVIPRCGQKTLLIECNGDWVHSLPSKRAADRAKSTYISKYHSDSYELKTIWEHEFADFNRVAETIKYWLGLTKYSINDFDFHDVIIRSCAAADYRGLLNKYHYLPNAGRGGIAYGAYLNTKLVAVCVFSPLPRQNINIRNLPFDIVRDLSRLCIHPNYQKRNFGSWFVARCIKMLPLKYRAVVAFADTTFNHTGSIYKACNFEFDGEVKPEYWYTSHDGWVIHKKTLYNKAVKLGLTEREYVDRFNYVKTHGYKKLRFVFMR